MPSVFRHAEQTKLASIVRVNNCDGNGLLLNAKGLCILQVIILLMFTYTPTSLWDR